MKYIPVLALLLLSACAPHKLEGMCSTPAVNGGEPFDLPEGASLEGGNLVVRKTGTKMTFTGVICVIKE